MTSPPSETVILGRLKKRPEFVRLNKEGQRWTAPGMTVQTAAHDEGPETIRFGLTITKKIYKEAVKRNRIRRRLRALAMAILPEHGRPGHDYVLIGRAATLDRPYDDLKKDLLWCLKKLHQNT